MFFNNGNTAATDVDGQQIPELQRSWLVLFAEFLEKQGVDPLQVEFMLPGGLHARLFKIPYERGGGFKWHVER